jgi:transcriptional regulator with XRE-family HTH domain
MNITLVIKKLRKQKGLSQAELGNRSGLSTTYISQLEGGKKSPTLNSLEKISTVLGVPFPLLSFMALEKDDIHPDKQEAYTLIKPSLNALIGQLFLQEETET